MLSDELIAKIRMDLEALPLQPTSRRELELLVLHIAESIQAAQERGATYIEIARQISASGYPIKRSTLCAALLRLRKNGVRPKQMAGRSAVKSMPARSARAASDDRPANSGRPSQSPSSSSGARTQSTGVTNE